jgi:hypothetical protein
VSQPGRHPSASSGTWRTEAADAVNSNGLWRLTPKRALQRFGTVRPRVQIPGPRHPLPDTPPSPTDPGQIDPQQLGSSSCGVHKVHQGPRRLPPPPLQGRYPWTNRGTYQCGPDRAAPDHRRLPDVYRVEGRRAPLLLPTSNLKQLVLRASGPDSDREEVEGDALKCLRLDTQRE